MKKYLILFILSLFACHVNAAIEYKLRYIPASDVFEVSFVSTVSYLPSANVFPSQVSVAFDPVYNTGPGSPTITSLAGGSWTPQDKVTGNTGTLNGKKVILFIGSGANFPAGITAGTNYPLFRFTFGSAANNCGTPSNTSRLFVNGVDPIDPNGAGGDFTSLLNINGADFLSTNNDVTFRDCVGLTVVPVRFLGFTAVRSGDDAMLNWNVSNEDANVQRYEVERSTNRLDFYMISTVAAKNNNQPQNSYDLRDRKLSSLKSKGVLYYRIKQVDVSGKYIYSEIRTIRLNQNDFAALLYPNPARSVINVEVDIPQAMAVTMTVTDVSGKEISRLDIKGISGLNQQRINISGLAAGSYLLTIRMGDQSQSIPFVKSL